MKKIEDIVSDAKKHLFRVGNVFVKVPAGETLVVKDGDMVAVAGYMRKGIIVPWAINNVTEQVIWHESYVLPLLAGFLVVACGIFVITGASVPLIVLGCVVTFIGMLMMARGIAIILAVNSVSRMIERT